MNHRAKSIRTFIGAKDFQLARQFYQTLGFEEIVISPDMSFFKTNNMGFYLQDAYVKDWIDNTMVFLEVEELEHHYNELTKLDLPASFPGVRVSTIRYNDWGKEYFVHDPSGVLWHFGSFQ
jgi:catechol 2,3-dioxygenase-like lactoylglutathione lyase family enzyme